MGRGDCNTTRAAFEQLQRSRGSPRAWESLGQWDEHECKLCAQHPARLPVFSRLSARCSAGKAAEALQGAPCSLGRTWSNCGQVMGSPFCKQQGASRPPVKLLAGVKPGGSISQAAGGKSLLALLLSDTDTHPPPKSSREICASAFPAIF